MKNLVLSGHLAYDRIVKVDSKFNDLSRTQSPVDFSLLGKSQEIAFGGCVGNVAYGLHKSNIRFKVLSVLGSLDGQGYLDHFSNLNIDTSLISSQENNLTSTAYMFSDNEDNQMIFFVPMPIFANQEFYYDFPDPSEIDFFFISADVIYLMNHIADFCRKNSIPFAFDPGQQLNNYIGKPEDFLEAINGAELLFLNELEYKLVLETLNVSEDEILNRVQSLIVTKSCKPINVKSLTLDVNFEVSVDCIDNPVDTTGAGDAFRAGFMDSYLNDKDLKECVINGSILASKSVLHKHPQGYEI